MSDQDHAANAQNHDDQQPQRRRSPPKDVERAEPDETTSLISDHDTEHQDSVDQLPSSGGILKQNRSASQIAWENDYANRRPSAIHRSLANFKRVSIGGISQLNPDGSTVDAAAPLQLPGGRRLSARKLTSYGSLYPTMYQRLSVLHRLSFADIVERITLTWENIDVYAPAVKSKDPVKRNGLSASGANTEPMQQKHILRDVSGVVEPNTLLAVMGASGSGKTTLLNVLTYRNRGNLIINGEVRVNGGMIGKGMSSMSGYIQQEDLFIGTLTVREHLWFQSQLKMDKEITSDIRAERVADVMHELGLAKCADTMIGIPGRIKGVSGGERKRLAFASELLTNPPLLFLDEPTSGLDSYMAQNILKTLKTMASKGRTIMCTIHQPSSEVFELFDRLLLMAEGRVAYLGPAQDATKFFGSCGYHLPPNYNPADFLVHSLAIEPGNEAHCREKIQKICDAYKQAPQAEYVKKIVSDANFHEDGAMYDEESFSEIDPYKASWFKQFAVVFWRCWLNNMREPAIVRTRFLQVITLGFVFGLIYWQQNLDQLGVANINGSLFLMQTQMTFGFIFNVVMAFPPEFPIFLREHFDGMYRVDVYFLCKTMAEVPQFLLLPLIFTIIMYFCVGLYLTAEAFFINFAVNFLVCNVSISFGYLLSCATSNIGMALSLGPLFVIPCSMIGGFFVNPESIPVYFIWLKYLSWFTYANEILIINQWKDITHIDCPPLVDPVFSNTTASWQPTAEPVDDSMRCFTKGSDVISSFGYKESNVVFDFIMLVVLLAVFRIIAFILLFLRARKTYKISKKAA